MNGSNPPIPEGYMLSPTSTRALYPWSTR